MTIDESILAPYQRVYAKVDLDAIVSNMRQMKQNINKETRMIAVIKTDGYGHGAVPIAKELEKLDFMYGFAVATAEEAFFLREQKITKPILILGHVFPYAYERLIREEIRFAAFREDCLSQINEVAQRVGKKAYLHIKVDTGMRRIGIRPDDSGLNFVKKVLQFSQLATEGIFTHFATADQADKSFTREQFQRFASFVNQVEQLCGKSLIRHCSNSAGILELQDMNMDVVRAGITLYGLAPSDEVDMKRVLLKPAMSLYSTVTFCKTVYPGEGISYGMTFVAKEQMRVATIPAGYGDGYPRSLSGKGYVLIHGQKAPILGRVCMDQFMVDVTNISDVKEGDEVVLMGSSGEETISAEFLGDLSGRFNYELVCCIGERVPRLFVKNQKVIGVMNYHDYHLLAEE